MGAVKKLTRDCIALSIGVGILPLVIRIRSLETRQARKFFGLHDRRRKTRTLLCSTQMRLCQD